MIRLVLASLLLMAGCVGLVLFGALQPENVYAFSPQTLRGGSPFQLDFLGEPLLVSTDGSDSACLPVYSITKGDGAPFLLADGALEGPLTSVAICDLDADGNLELAIISSACGEDSIAQICLLEWEGESWVERSRGELPDNPGGGYRGRGEITLAKRAILHRYELFALEVAPPMQGEGAESLERDADAVGLRALAGGERLVEYRLVDDNVALVGFVESRR